MGRGPRPVAALGAAGAGRHLLAWQRLAGNRAVASRVQRQTPAPAPAVSPPGYAPPGQGPAPGESSDVVLPPPGASLRVPLTAGRKFPITKEDLSEFNIGVGELETDTIPLGESGVQAQVKVGSADPLTLADASLVVSPIVGTLDAGDVERTRRSEEKGGLIGGAVGGGLAPMFGPLGPVLGKEIGAWATGDHFVRFRLEEASLGGSFRVTYHPYLKLKLSVVGTSWLLDATATLSTNLSLVVAPRISFKDSSLSLIFRGGRLAHTEFDLKAVATPELDLVFDADGQLKGAVNLLPILGKDRGPDALAEDEGVQLAEVELAPFRFLTYRTTIAGATVDLHAAKGSPFEVLTKSAKGAGKVSPATDDFVAKSGKRMPFSVPPDVGGRPPQTGRDPSKAIPLVWYKPFNRYLPYLVLPTSEFGSRRTAGRFPNKRYRYGPTGADIRLGVDSWPGRGSVLRKRGNERGGEVPAFRDACAQHGITIPSGYQIDHVTDLVFEGGHDEPHNLWPLLADVNTRAGGMWSNGLALVQWRHREVDPPVRSAPSAVPRNRYFVVVDVQDPPG